MLRRFLLAAAVPAALLAGAPAAQASLAYEGETSQGNEIGLRTDDAGTPERAFYVWDAECKGAAVLTDAHTTTRLENAAADGFSVRSKYTANIEGRYEGRYRTRFTGRRVSDTTFRGNFEVRVRIHRRSSGELLTRCSTGIVRWSAAGAAPPVLPLPRTTPGRLAPR